LNRRNSRETPRRRAAHAALAAAALAAGCDRPPPAAPAAAAAPATVQLVADSQPAAPPAASPILSESAGWTREQAVERMGDPAAAVSAALRLVRLAQVPGAEFPEPLPPETAAALRVHTLPGGSRVVGVAESDDPRRLRAPVLIDADGTVAPPGAGKGWTLHIGSDADVFPHLFIGPGQVLNAADVSQAALVLLSPPELFFDLRYEGDLPYVGLMLPSETEAVEVGRFAWEPYEGAFLGPAMDKLPTPPGGVYKMDLKASTALQPVGGLIEEPDPVTKPTGKDEKDKPGEDDLPPPY
jgi:hypothetical protein